MRHLPLITAVAVLALAAPAEGGVRKAIWGPTEFPRENVNCPGVKCSAFPVYRELRADVYQFQLPWDQVAPTRPADPRNPFDPAYRWPAYIDFIVGQAALFGIRPAAMIQRTPAWANGARGAIWAPSRPRDFADFAYAASRRYPSVLTWMIWGEPSRADRFQPLPKGKKKGPRIYGRMLDASFKALNQANRRNVVIGGMTVNGGTILPPKFLKLIRRKGRMPRADLWGHNPFERRFPRLKKKPIGKYRGLNDVDTLWAEIRRAYRRQKGKRRSKTPKGLWLSEWTIPTDHPAPVFGNSFFVSRQEQARRIRAGYAIARKLKYVKALGYFTLLDQPGATANAWGLMTATGERKPGFFAYQAVP